MKKETITLRKLLEGLDACFIEYRTFTPYGMDMFTGACEYKDGKLTALGYDEYSLGDEFIKYEFSENKRVLAVWYASKWTTEEEPGDTDLDKAISGVTACEKGLCYVCPYNDDIKSTEGCKHLLYAEILRQLKAFKEGRCSP